MGRFNRREPPPIVPGTNMRRPPRDIRPDGDEYDLQGPSYGQPSNPNQQQQPPKPMTNPMASYGASGAPAATGSAAAVGGTGKAEVYRSDDDLARDAYRELLENGQRDTTAEEKQIMDMLQSNIGKNQADLNARMAAGGFGTSGALGQMGADMRAQATREALDEIMGVRNDAYDDYLRATQLGMQGNYQDRRFDMDEEQWAQTLDALNRANYDPKDPYGVAPNSEYMGADRNQDGELSDYELKVWEMKHSQDEEKENERLNEEGQRQHYQDAYKPFGEPGAGMGAPEDAEDYQTWQGEWPPLGITTGNDGTYQYIFGTDSKLWKVRIG
jgi:hypothetical protein